MKSEMIKIRRSPKGKNGIKSDFSPLDNVISLLLKDLTEKCVNEKDNLHITGEEVCLLMKELNEKACEASEGDESIKPSSLFELKLFSQVQHYYRFHIKDRKYQSFRVEFATQDQEDNRAGLARRFNDLIHFANDPDKDKANRANTFNLCSTLIQHIYQTLNPENPDMAITHGECHEIDEGYMRSNDVPLNDYHKSDLLTWNRLLQEDGAYSHSVYPYCKFLEMDDHNQVILLIVTKLDQNYVDEKVRKIDKIEPIHMIVLKCPDLFRFGENELKTIEFKLRHAIGYLSYAVFAGRTNESLASMSTEAALVARHWYSAGIEKIFPKEEDEQEENITGMGVSQKIVEEMLCADVAGLETLEVFPFDRVYLFTGANFRAINKDPGTNFRANSSMKLTVLEAAVKSKRPQDNSRFLSTMERLEKKADHYDQPGLDIFFDVTQKKIGYQTNCLIDANGKEWELRTTDNKQKNKFAGIIENLEEEEENILERERDKIDAVIKTLFSGFVEVEDPELQAYCQQTYQFYDADGLCLLNDFAVDVGEIPGLKKIQDAYFEVFFSREIAEWKRLWKDNPQNIPHLEGFKQWLEKRESKVILIAFDPYQNLSNMDREGKRYLEDDDSFTMILVADEDVGKNNFDLQTEILDLRQMLLMVIRRRLREARMKKEVIREQKKLFTTMMSAIMHRFKNYVPKKAQQVEIDQMRERFERVFEAEDYSARYKEFPSTREVYDYFLAPFINEQLGEKIKAMGNTDLKHKVEMACKEYLGKLKTMKSAKINLKELKVKFNKNYFPHLTIKLQEDFVKEAVKILINNAVEHTAIYCQQNPHPAEIILSFNLSPHLEKDFYSFEFSILNPSEPIPQQKLKLLNSPAPKQSPTDTLKASSTGIGIFIARTQLQKSIGKGADIRLDNVGENYIEAKLILPAKRIRRLFDDDRPEPTDGLPKYEENGYILYVEDIPEIQENSKQALVKLLGDETRLFACDNRQEALSVIEKAMPSIILLDMKILRSPNAASPTIDDAIDVVEEVLNQKAKIPIVMLSHRSRQEIEALLKERLNLENYQIQVMDFDQKVEIKEKTIVIPSYDIKRLSDEEGMGLMRALAKWVKQQMKLEIKEPGLYETPDVESSKTEHPFVTVDFNDQAFDKKLENYRSRNISHHIPNEIFIATAKPEDEDTLFETTARWFSHPGLKSFYEDELERSRFLPLTRNERFRTLFLNIQIPENRCDWVDLKFRYWCLPHNILISTPAIKIDKKLAWKWKFTPHGVRGTLSNLRHDIKNMLDVNERTEIIKQLNALESQFVFKEENLSSNLKHAFENREKSILETLKNRADKTNLVLKNLFAEVNHAFYELKSINQKFLFVDILERLREFLEQ